MEFRCPAHDVVFSSETDHTKPGSKVTHPRHKTGNGVNDCHPDCPIGQKQKQTLVGPNDRPSQVGNRDGFTVDSQQKTWGDPARKSELRPIG